MITLPTSSSGLKYFAARKQQIIDICIGRMRMKISCGLYFIDDEGDDCSEEE